MVMGWTADSREELLSVEFSRPPLPCFLPLQWAVEQFLPTSQGHSCQEGSSGLPSPIPIYPEAAVLAAGGRSQTQDCFDF